MARSPEQYRRRVDTAAAIVALAVFVLTLGLLIWGHALVEERSTTTTTSTTVTTSGSSTTTEGTTGQTVTGTNPAVTDGESTGSTSTGPSEQTTVTSTDLADDNSLLGRAFDNPNVLVVLEVLLALLAGFLAGAGVQRVLLGSYGIKIGNLELEPIGPVTKQEVEKATKDLIDVKSLPQRGRTAAARAEPPCWATGAHEIASNLRLSVIARRIDFEVGIRDVANRYEVRGSLTSALAGLSEKELVSNDFVKLAFELIALGDRLLSGADITDPAAVLLQNEFNRAIKQLVKLL